MVISISKGVVMGFNRRQLILSGVSAGVSVASPALWAQAKGGKKIVLGQSVPLTGAADQIGLAYLNGAKIYFDAINAKNGAGGYKIEVKALDDGYVPAKAAANAKQLIDEGVDALFGFTGTASCDAGFAAAKASGTLFFAPFAASDTRHVPALANVFHVRPALADEADKIA
ncbi:MAG: ABC transporter substrate-binding protein, partial [Bacteroidia bacterium]|nr:ABC transporter substrate-binding protein [Bacteroidia bacterium]